MYHLVNDFILLIPGRICHDDVSDGVRRGEDGADVVRLAPVGVRPLLGHS